MSFVRGLERGLGGSIAGRIIDSKRRTAELGLKSAQWEEDSYFRERSDDRAAAAEDRAAKAEAQNTVIRDQTITANAIANAEAKARQDANIAADVYTAEAQSKVANSRLARINADDAADTRAAKVKHGVYDALARREIALADEAEYKVSKMKLDDQAAALGSLFVGVDGKPIANAGDFLARGAVVGAVRGILNTNPAIKNSLLGEDRDLVGYTYNPDRETVTLVVHNKTLGSTGPATKNRTAEPDDEIVEIPVDEFMGELHTFVQMHGGGKSAAEQGVDSTLSGMSPQQRALDAALASGEIGEDEHAEGTARLTSEMAATRAVSHSGAANRAQYGGIDKPVASESRFKTISTELGSVLPDTVTTGELDENGKPIMMDNRQNKARAFRMTTEYMARKGYRSLSELQGSGVQGQREAFAIMEGAAVVAQFPHIRTLDPLILMATNGWPADRMKAELQNIPPELGEDGAVHLQYLSEVQRAEAAARRAGLELSEADIRQVALENTMGIEQAPGEAPAASNGGYGERPDGTAKGSGFLGEIPLPDGGVATEYSVQSDAVKAGGKRVDFPTLVPTLSRKELDLMVNDIIPNGKPVPEAIMQKAIAHAKDRIRKGKSPFAEPWEKPGTLEGVDGRIQALERTGQAFGKVLGAAGRAFEAVRYENPHTAR